MALDWLATNHPLYDEQVEFWERMERRFFGGEPVLEELQPFRWEVGSEGEASLEKRSRQATYINFPDLFARTTVGHLMRNAPFPEQGLSFGALGIAGSREGNVDPTQAELVYYNADGIGNDGSQWDNFWAQVARNSFATGHRWVMVEAPSLPEGTEVSQQDELDGKRPYLIEFSPRAVTNWEFTEGRLDFAVVTTRRRNPRIDEHGDFVGNDFEDFRIFMVRQNVDRFGSQFAGGGWWEVDPDFELTGRQGTWEKTEGDIPMWVHYYERAKGEHMSRSGIVEISQAAVSYMNLSSAADFDVWDAASSQLFVLGADVEGFNLMIEKMKAGTKVVPVAVNKSTNDVPDIYDGSTGAVVAEAFEARLERKLAEVTAAAALEATSTPDSSGESKKAGFADVTAPRLALLASEMEQSQNTAIRFLELRFGHTDPGGDVNWRRDFELMPLVDSIREVFELAVLADVESPTLTTNGIMALVRTRGLARGDEEEATIEGELAASVAARQRRAEQGFAFDAELDGTANLPPFEDDIPPGIEPGVTEPAGA